ncbi:phosphatases II [Violaceomyces palustris]|uniref:Phosphatases II n=1 Tax=Violaceomyces palustris TaxID=1673888 RepID=A0ACD0P2S7_9BASI|nr:phosphatases II [Violaceomyces palustris]
MQGLKIEKVENVLLQPRRSTACLLGTLRLTRHHLLFHPDDESGKVYEVPYSLVSLATRLPSMRTLSGFGSHQNGGPLRLHPLSIHQKDFESYTFAFATEATQNDVFESIKNCAVVSDISDLYAFYYQPQEPRSFSGGWSVYDFKKEFTRQGLGTRTKAWRISDINSNYSFCPTYPAQLVVPSRISDATLGYASKYRSKARIPALTYLHWANQGSITRSSQPMVGLKQNRSIQDEKLIEAIFTSHHFADPTSKAAAAAAAVTASQGSSQSGASTLLVYGATSTNLIIDARPTTNAMANVARGAGTENMEHYKGCKKAYLGIDNIHVMRDSLNRLTECLREALPPATFDLGSDAEATTVAPPAPLDSAALKRTSWLKHISTLLEGSMLIARNIHINSSHVLIHCSDGWDRTSQLSAIAQICLDPFYRTFEGFAVLVEKDWVSFGHQFGERGGIKGSEKYFTTAAGHGAGYDDDDDNSTNGNELDGDDPSSGFDSQAAATAFWGFTKQLTANFSSGSSSSHSKGSHIKETSPVFHQYLDCVFQIMRQYPQRFEFNEDYLVEVFRVANECKHGTFLLDCERERLKPLDVEGRAKEPIWKRTLSAWDYLLSEEVKARFRNERYDVELDDRDPKKPNTDLGVLLADPREVRYFEKLFKRDLGEMNAGLEREAEDRRRAKERLEKAVRGERQATFEGAELTPEVDEDGFTSIVEPGGQDPVLDPVGSLAAKTFKAPTDTAPTSNVPGAVDLATGKTDPAKLGYEVRVPRRKANEALPVSSPSPSLTERVLARGSGLQPSSSSQSLSGQQMGVGVSAGDAANRMKNLFLGGWGRIQDAVAGPNLASSTTTSSSSSSSTTPSVETASAKGSTIDPLGQLDPWAASTSLTLGQGDHRDLSTNASPSSPPTPIERGRPLPGDTGSGSGQDASYHRQSKAPMPNVGGPMSNNPWARQPSISAAEREIQGGWEKEQAPGGGVREFGSKSTYPHPHAGLVSIGKVAVDENNNAERDPKHDEGYDPLGVGGL